MKKLLATLFQLSPFLFAFSLSAAIPQHWTVETSRVQPAQFEAYHGETIEFAAAMQTYGKPLAITNDLIGIYWQTNGMGSAYWTAPAVLSNNVITARWTPSMDVGANVYSCFIGAPGEIYRAAFQLRLRPSPGAVPSELPLPVKTLDFAQVTVLNAPYYAKSETDAKIIELAPAPGNYATVSNRAMTAVQPTAISDMETQTHAAATYQPKGSYLTSESDPTVYPWAKATSKPSYTWTEIGSKPTTIVGYGITDAYTKAQVDTALNAKSDKFDVNGVAPDNGNVDVKEIYNSNKTQKIDGNGDVYVGETNTGGSWRHTNGAVMSYYDNSGSVYTWRTADGRQSVSYNSGNGNVTVTGNYYGTIQTGLNPLNGDDLGAVTSGVNVVTFTKQQTQFPDEPTTRLAKLNDIPTALKCPAALTIQLNGTTAATYDGSAARTVNITTGGAPGATVASAALEYHADGQAISVSVAAAGTLTAVVNSWTDGQSQMAFVTLAAGASVAPAIKLIGYSEWPIGEEFMAVCTKRGSKIYVNPVCVTEE